MGDDDRWLPLSAERKGLPTGVQDLADIVSIHLQDIPSPRLPEAPWILNRHPGRSLPVQHRTGPAILLKAVVVQNRGQVIQAVALGHEGRFPDLPFLDLSVAEHDPGVEILAQ